MRRVLLWILLAMLSPVLAEAQSLGGSCTGSAVSSQTLDGGLLKCNGSTWVGSNIYANSFTAGATGDGLGHAQVFEGSANAGYVGFNNPDGSRLGYVGFGTVAGGMNLTTDKSTPLNFLVSGTTAMTILPNGNVGIGTSSPAQTLSVNGYIDTNGSLAGYVVDPRTGTATYIILSAGNNFNIFYNTQSLFTMTTAGNVTILGTLTQNSDARLKTNVQQLPADVFEKLALIRGVTFNWKGKDRDPRQQVGVIAQEVQKAYPQLVTADASGTLSVNYSGLTAPLIEAVKQLKAENDQLRQEVEADHRQAQLDHDLLFKMRHHVALTDYEQTPYTESAWQYAPEPRGWKPPHGPTIQLAPTAPH